MATRATKPLLRARKGDRFELEARERAVAYYRLLVPLGNSRESARAMTVGCGLAADRRAALTALSVVEIPAELPLAAQMLEEEAEAHRRVSEARAIAELYGVSLVGRVRRARSTGEAIIEEAAGEGSEIIVMGALRKPPSTSRHAQIFGKTVDYVLRHASCRVVVAALPPDV